MNDRELYSIVGISTLLTTVTLPTISILPLSIGAIGVGSLYGCYRILTRHERKIKEERKEFEEFFMGAGLMNKQNEIPILANIYENDYETIYSFIKPSGFSTVNFESRDVAIQEYFGREMIEFESKGDFINIKVTTADLPNFIPFQMKERKNKDEIIVSLGRDIKGNDVELNLSKCPNVMCSGCTRQWQVG